MLLLAACGGDPEPSGAPTASVSAPDPSSTSSTPIPPVSTAASPTHPATATVPGVEGFPFRDARRTIRAAGLRFSDISGPGTACLPANMVLAQDPMAGTEVPWGSAVEVQVNHATGMECGLNLPSADPALESVGKRFIGFAQGSVATPPARAPMALYLGGVLAKNIPAGRLGDPVAWRGCPAGGSYAARDCPISILEPIARTLGPIAITSAAPEHPCANPATLPAEVGTLETVTLTPDEGRDCTSYYGLQLFFNDAREIVAVNLVLAEP